MSLTAFKRKSAITHGSKRSGSAPGGIWLTQGPFGHSTNGLQMAPGPVGFSINGGHRNVGGVGKDMKMSKSGTPYRGTQPIGYGGTYGTYPSAILVGENSTAIPNAGSKLAAVHPVLNSQRTIIGGTQYQYIKPSVLSTRGMLHKKYKYVYSGTYPNYWVQPIYTGNQVGTGSQQMYIENKAASNTCSLNVNNKVTYENPEACKTSDTCKPVYTKTLYQPVSYGQYNMSLTRKCYNPNGVQKPFPFAVQTGKSQSDTGGSNGCGTSNIYLTPPDWYIA